MEKTRAATGPQNLMLENREKLLIQGVQQVESFDEESIQLDTLLGALVIREEGCTSTGSMTRMGKWRSPGRS